MSKLTEYSKAVNIAESLDDKQLADIGQQVIKGYQIDKASRVEWEHVMEEALKISKQIFEPKKAGMLSKAANVKFPLLTKGCIDFAARTYTEILGGERIVFSKVAGPDPEYKKAARAKRVMDYMNYQLRELMPEWEDGMDSLLHMLPIYGTVFKKVYWDVIDGRSCSEVIEPADIVVNGRTKSLEKARRITHVLTLYRNDIVERQRADIYCDFPIDELHNSLGQDDSKLRVEQDKIIDDIMDEDRPYRILEQHCYLDLDDDGYDEPYVVTVAEESCKVLRIKARFGKITKSKDKIKKIVPINYFIDYHYIKNPDGSFYSLGLGALLLPINESINTLINQLIDAGTLSNLQGGFLGSGLRMKGGEIRLQAGEWKMLETAMGADIKNNIVPLPVKEPSQTLFNLLELLIGIGSDLASINDVMKGNTPGTNVPATTIMSQLEQGMKVVNSIHKRVFASLKREFRRLFELNAEYLSDDDYSVVIDYPYAVASVDFNLDDCDVCPAADPNLSSDAQRLTRSRALLELSVQMPGVLSPQAVAVLNLQSMQYEESEIQALVPAPNPNEPPPPEAVKDLAQADLFKVQAMQIQQQLGIDQYKVQVETAKAQQDINESSARVQKMSADAQINAAKLQHVSEKLQSQQIKDTTSAIQGDAKLALDNKRIETEIQRELIKSETQVNVAKTKPGSTSS